MNFALYLPDILFSRWFRLHTDTLLRKSQIFPDVKLRDKLPDYEPSGFGDIWKGTYHGRPVCVKAIRATKTIHSSEIERVCGSFHSSEVYSACFIPDPPQAHFPSELTPHH